MITLEQALEQAFSLVSPSAQSRWIWRTPTGGFWRLTRWRGAINRPSPPRLWTGMPCVGRRIRIKSSANRRRVRGLRGRLARAKPCGFSRAHPCQMVQTALFRRKCASVWAIISQWKTRGQTTQNKPLITSARRVRISRKGSFYPHLFGWIRPRLLCWQR